MEYYTNDFQLNHPFPFAWLVLNRSFPFLREKKQLMNEYRQLRKKGLELRLKKINIKHDVKQILQTTKLNTHCIYNIMSFIQTVL